MRPICPPLAQMTTRTIASRRIIEQRKPTSLGLGKLNLPIHPLIEAAVERIEARILKLKSLNCRSYRRQCLLRIIERMLSKDAPKLPCVRCFPHRRCNMLRIHIRHLVEIEQRKRSLRSQGY